MTNKPYIKGVDSLPHIHQFPNRRKRRAEMFKRNEKKIMGNHKGVKLTVSGTNAYHRVLQYVIDKTNLFVKTIINFISKTK